MLLYYIIPENVVFFFILKEDALGFRINIQILKKYHEIRTNSEEDNQMTKQKQKQNNIIIHNNVVKIRTREK